MVTSILFLHEIENPANSNIGGDKMQKFTNLNNLLQNDANASQFFAGLPDYVQQTIQERADSIHDQEDLETYANNLLQGDD